MREQINKVKNFGKFLNENKYYDEESRRILWFIKD